MNLHSMFQLEHRWAGRKYRPGYLFLSLNGPPVCLALSGDSLHLFPNSAEPFDSEDKP